MAKRVFTLGLVYTADPSAWPHPTHHPPLQSWELGTIAGVAGPKLKVKDDASGEVSLVDKSSKEGVCPFPVCGSQQHRTHVWSRLVGLQGPRRPLGRHSGRADAARPACCHMPAVTFGCPFPLLSNEGSEHKRTSRSDYTHVGMICGRATRPLDAAMFLVA